jgi:hypothetical protein
VTAFLLEGRGGQKEVEEQNFVIFLYAPLNIHELGPSLSGLEFSL